MKANKQIGKGTRAVHAGVEPDPSTGAIMTPIFQTSTYIQEAVGVHKGWEYSRSSNPTRAALESAFAELESGTHGLAFASAHFTTNGINPFDDQNCKTTQLRMKFESSYILLQST